MTLSLSMATRPLLLSIMLAALVVNAAEITYCKTDADCTAVLAYDLCQAIEGSTLRQCRHKPLFPMTG